jgi:tetratricopeptide (TPR) repeat protein
MYFCLLLFQLATGNHLVSVDSADDAFRRIDYQTALEGYTILQQANPNRPDLLWRLARVSVCMGETADGPRRGEYFKSGEQYARQCIALDSMSVEGHTWLAAALGYIAYYSDKSEQVRLAWEILKEADRAIQLDPRNDAAYSIKGSVYRALGGASWIERQLAQLFIGRLPPGGYEEGEEALKQAIAFAPDVMRHHYELGVLYRDWGKTEEAKKSLERARDLPVRVAIDRPRLETIKEVLATLE